ncbi:MAG TPA: hypothetical protein VG165_11330 [Solirubrobacteraceae bacterium]|jgi:hypothetical protein|nr:hypothetical protein [Solirubrobacteraceae bacterium]
MRRHASAALLGLLLATGATAGLIATPAALAASAGTSSPLHRTFKRTCDTPSPGHAACNAIVVTSPTATTPTQPNPLTAGPNLAPLATPAGFGPTDLRSAYAVASAAAANGAGEKVAIVDADDDPNAASDLATYRSTYGLPACTQASGCFTKVNQSGGTSYPAGNAGWSEEISLDLDMVSAICPNCKIILVEASSTSYTSLGTAVNEAAALGATQISNSYGGSEFSGESSTGAAYYEHPGVDVTVSSGDGGYGVEFPAASQYVTAVGGTSLVRASNGRGWSESAWSDAGSGCSSYVPKPSYQHDTGCGGRTVADVSAVADPNTPVAVYDSYRESGWLEFGGTSVASPLVASIYALAGGRSPGNTFGAYAYANPSQYNDVVGGSNGSCGGSYLCTGVAGYDGPTGVGSPNGAGPVTPPTPVPTLLTPPAVSGSPIQGHTLSTTPGTWTGSPTSYAYQWYDCSTTATSSCTSPVAGATAATYTLPGGYTGYVSVAVTATNAGGPSSPALASPAVGPVAELPPVNTTAPAISGPPHQGQTLTASTGTWTNSPTSFTYQWYDCTTAATASCSSLGAAATGSTYPLPAGYTLFVTVGVTAHNAGGASPAVLASPAVGPVTAGPPPSFTLAASPASQSVTRGKSAAYTITVTPAGGFTGSVGFTAGGLPSGVAASFSPNPSTGATTLTLTSTTSSTAGTYTIPVTGTSGTLTAGTTVSLTLGGTCFFGFCF